MCKVFLREIASVDGSFVGSRGGWGVDNDFGWDAQGFGSAITPISKCERSGAPATATANTGVSPLRRKCGAFGRDDGRMGWVGLEYVHGKRWGR